MIKIGDELYIVDSIGELSQNFNIGEKVIFQGINSRGYPVDVCGTGERCGTTEDFKPQELSKTRCGEPLTNKDFGIEPKVYKKRVIMD